LRVAATECLLSGTAVVWDHYYHADAVIAGLRDVGLSAVMAPTLQDLSGPGVGQCEAQIEATLRIAGDDGLHADGIVAALGPHATDTVSDRLWQRVGLLAEENDLPVHAHVAQSIDEFERSMEWHGETPLGRLGSLGLLGGEHAFLLVHGLYVNEADLKSLAPERHVLGYCPYSQIQFAFPAHIRAWRDAGVPLALGTDAGCCNDTMNVQQELRGLASGNAFAVSASEPYRAFLEAPDGGGARAVQEHRQISYDHAASFAAPSQLLSSVWGTAGQLHPRLRTGEISSGMRANLLVLDLDHPSLWPATDPLRSLVLSEISPAIVGMMVNGSWRGELGDFQRSILGSDDHREALTEAKGRLKALLNRAGLA
jgi:cytosine/adenosine deaminase-related metal-dependent hydrolase